MNPHEPVLAIDNLRVAYPSARGWIQAVDGVSLTVHPGELVGLAGESGSGKSTLAQAALRLIEPPRARVEGSVRVLGHDLFRASPEEVRRLRWEHIAIVFQSAMHALNPVLSVGEQIVDAIAVHRPEMSRKEAWDRAAELLALVEIPRERVHSYPHELSGGMRQRVGIAMALALQPELVVMDEPTTALDVVVQRQILEKVMELQSRFRFAVLFITHDLSLLVQIAHRIAIMYAGRLVETAPARAVLEDPWHPYTQGLIASFPPLHGEKRELTGIPGSPPDLAALPPGCPFHPRCSRAMDRCREAVPPLVSPAGDARQVACHLFPSPAQPDGTGEPSAAAVSGT